MTNPFGLGVDGLPDYLTRVERNMDLPNQRPKDAATLILIDRTGTTPKLLMGRRNPAMKFMPGKLVFPGGRVDAADRAVPVAAPLAAACAAKLIAKTVKPTPRRGPALALAAIREAYEETGFLMGQRTGAPWPAGIAAGPWAPFAERGIVPDLSALTFIARAITPPRRPKRFDTRFFVADLTAAAERAFDVVGPDHELVELKWLTLEETTGEDLPPITRAILVELGAFFANPSRPAPYYHWDKGRFVREEV